MATVEFTAEGLRTVLRQVGCAMSRDDTRSALFGMFVEIDAESITFTATDSYRLATRRVEVEGDGESVKVVMPSPFVLKLIAACGKAGKRGEAELTVEADKVSARVTRPGYSKKPFEPIEIEAASAGAEFPNYRQLFPSEWRATFTVARAEALATALRAVDALGANTPARLSLNGEVKVEATRTDHATLSIEVSSSVEHEGDELTVGFCPAYLIDGIEAAELAGQVVIQANDGLKPALITGAGGPEPTFRYLLMPVRLS